MSAITEIRYIPLQTGGILDDDLNEKDESEIKTCHLCGKAKCGQRKGRVRCSQCKRIFCIQQLVKKFKMKAVPDQPNFICPRCLGICCCVTNCQMGPPHVHCKVFKVRQNKKRYREMSLRENAEREKAEQMYASQMYAPPLPMSMTHSSSFSLFSNFGFDARMGLQDDFAYHQLQNSGMLLSLNRSALGYYKDELEDVDETLYSKIKEYIQLRNSSPTQDFPDRHIKENDILELARKLRRNAEKSETLYKTVMSFNDNTTHVKARWVMNGNRINSRQNGYVIPGLFTIITCCKSILFSLETDTNYQEDLKDCSVSISLFDTSAFNNIPLLRACIAILNQTFSHFDNINYEETWEPLVSSVGKSKNELEYRRMLQFGEEAGAQFYSAKEHFSYEISFLRHRDDTIFENLPVLALVLKQVSEKDSKVVYSLQSMICTENELICELTFNKYFDLKSIMIEYKDTIKVKEIKK